MSFDNVKERIKKHEGYRLEPYYCTEGHLTGGYGHKILDGEEVPTDEEGWSKLFDNDFEKAKVGAESLLNVETTNPQAFGIIIEMCYQMGTTGVSKFKNCLKAIKDQNYAVAATEMLDSRWAKQTPNRASELALELQEII